MKAKPIVMLLTRETALRDEIVSQFAAVLGQADFVGPWHPFTHTKYYEPEMGEGLERCVVSFENLIFSYQLDWLKSLAKGIEDKYRVDGRRRVNVDPGCVDYHKVMLSSGKGGGHMIMISNDTFVDILLWYNKAWYPLPWAYPDFRNGLYFDAFEKIRKKLKAPR